MSAHAVASGRDAAGYTTDSHKWMVLIVVVLGSFMSILDATVVNIALPKLISVFSTDVHGAQWVLTSYLLALAVVIPLTGFLDETFGGKRMYIITLSLFTFASALCGISWSLNAMIGFRVFQGLGGGLIQPLGMSLLLKEFRPEERGTALGIFGIPLMLGPAVGPTLGGYFVQYLDWRLIFFINVPVGIAAVIASSRILREAPLHKGRVLDLWGIALVGIGSASLLLGIDNGPSDGWSSLTVLAEIIVGVVCLVSFVVVEMRSADPLLELRLFKSSIFTSALFVTLIVQVALFGATFLLPVFLQSLRGLGAMDTGVLLIPQALVVAVVMPISGRLYDRVGPRVLLVPGLILLTYASYLFTNLSLDTPNSKIIEILMLRGVGMGLVMMPATTTAMNAVPRHLIPRATALTNALQRISGSFGTAIMATVLTARQTYQFAMAAQTVNANNPTVHLVMSEAQAFFALHQMSAAVGQQLTVLMLYQQVAMTAAVRSFDDTFFVAAVLCIPAVFAALFVRAVPRQSGGAHAPIGE